MTNSKWCGPTVNCTPLALSMSSSKGMPVDAEHALIPELDFGQFADGNRERADTSGAVLVDRTVAECALGAELHPRLETAPRRDGCPSPRENSHFSSKPSGRLRDQGTGSLIATPAVAQLFRIASKIIGLHAIVDQPFAFLQRVPPAMIDRFAIKRDNFQIGSVGKRDQHVVAAHRMLPAGNDGEAKLLVVIGRLVEIFHDNDEMIDSFKHRAQ